MAKHSTPVPAPKSSNATPKGPKVGASTTTAADPHAAAKGAMVMAIMGSLPPAIGGDMGLRRTVGEIVSHGDATERREIATALKLDKQVRNAMRDRGAFNAQPWDVKPETAPMPVVPPSPPVDQTASIVATQEANGTNPAPETGKTPKGPKVPPKGDATPVPAPTVAKASTATPKAKTPEAQPAPVVYRFVALNGIISRVKIDRTFTDDSGQVSSTRVTEVDAVGTPLAYDDGSLASFTVQRGLCDTATQVNDMRRLAADAVFAGHKGCNVGDTVLVWTPRHGVGAPSPYLATVRTVTPDAVEVVFAAADTSSMGKAFLPPSASSQAMFRQGVVRVFDAPDMHRAGVWVMKAPQSAELAHMVRDIIAGLVGVSRLSDNVDDESFVKVVDAVESMVRVMLPVRSDLT